MSTTHKKIRDAVAKALRNGEPFTIQAEKTGIRDTEVVRVITPAWRKLDRVMRIGKIQDAIFPCLNATERKRIFRFSVMTQEEWDSIKTSRAGARPRVVGRRMAFATSD